MRGLITGIPAHQEKKNDHDTPDQKKVDKECVRVSTAYCRQKRPVEEEKSEGIKENTEPDCFKKIPDLLHETPLLVGKMKMQRTPPAKDARHIYIKLH
jgi:hypothetical protein